MRQSFRVQRVRSVIVPILLAMAFALPGSVFAQQTMNAQVVTAQGIALTAAEIGPEWTETRHVARRINGFDRYDVYFSAPSGRAMLISTAVADTPELAEAVLSVLRYEL